jgi:hypothetical protein
MERHIPLELALDCRVDGVELHRLTGFSEDTLDRTANRAESTPSCRVRERLRQILSWFPSLVLQGERERMKRGR